MQRAAALTCPIASTLTGNQGGRACKPQPRSKQCQPLSTQHINAEWLYGVDVGFSKNILVDKAKISFGVENLFARYLTADIRFANMDMIIHNRWDGPVVNAQFSYKFGNQHMKSKKGRNSSARDELNRAQKN